MNKKKREQSLNIEQINAQYGKLPPQAIDVEEAVLGAVMLERDAIHKVSPILVTNAFYKEEHQKIYETVCELSSGSHNIDLLTVTQRLKDKELLDMVGGPGYIARLTRNVSSAIHIEQHASIIRDKFISRELIRVCADLTSRSYDESSEDLEMFYAEQTQYLDDLMAGSAGMVHIRDILKQTAVDLEQKQEKIKNRETPGVTSGLVDLDRMNGGWQVGELVVIAARPAMGKTAIALNLFTKAPAMQGKNVCVFSLEMESIKLSQRLILSYGGIEREHFKNRTMAEGDWHAFNQAARELEQLPIYIDDSPGTTVKYIDAVVRNKIRKNECDLVVIDYLQLVESPGSYSNKNREREVAEISRALKKLSKIVPIVLLAQLNRDLEKRDDKKPRLSDLRESGAIEQDADIVAFPWRPCVYDPNAETENGVSLKNTMFIEIAKYRDGQIGTVLAKHNSDLTEFYDYNTYNQQENIDWTGGN